MTISPKQIKKELVWYYHQSSADLGISSNYSSIISAAFGFTPDASVNYTEDKFVAMASRSNSPIKKLRKVEQSLNQLSQVDQLIIDRLYNTHRYPPQLLSVYGEKTGAALFNTKLSIDSLISLCVKKLSKKKLSPQEESHLIEIKKQTDQLYEKVHLSYWEQRNLL